MSVLICTISSRFHMFIGLINSIQKLKQTSSLAIEVLYNNHETASIGEKRNLLLERAQGKYCAFVDDDDKITGDYFKVIEESELKYDCVVLNGIIYKNGKEDKPFYHSLKYDKWFSDEKGYYRNPNHLNPMKTDIARSIRFPGINMGEDVDFSSRLLKSGLLKTEYHHTEIQYLYMYVTDNPQRRYDKLNMEVKRFINRILKLKV